MKYVKQLLAHLYLVKLKFTYKGYQPLPWIGLNAKDRTQSSNDRWDAIQANIRNTPRGSVLDIGCNVGYFTLKYAQEGFFSIGVERESATVDFSNFLRHHLKMENVCFSHMEMNPDNIHSIPEVNIINLLSVWHHWVSEFGLEKGNQMLSAVWDKTQDCLIFEGGEDTELEKLGIADDAKKWTEEQLKRVCEGGDVIEIGKFNSEHPTAPVMRTLFMVKRKK